jgi:hypothetical protein
VSDTAGRRLKLAALACLVLLIVVLASFAVGEVAMGTISGLQHVVQLLPLAALGWLEWRRPLWGGALHRHGYCPPSGLIFPGLFLFVPALVAGVLFIMAGRRERATLGRDQGGS